MPLESTRGGDGPPAQLRPATPRHEAARSDRRRAAIGRGGARVADCFDMALVETETTFVETPTALSQFVLFYPGRRVSTIRVLAEATMIGNFLFTPAMDTAPEREKRDCR